MLIVSGTISLDPANHEAAVDAVGPLVEATLAEDGNITYGFWVHPSDRGEFRVYEEWEDQQAMDAHFATPHMAEFMGVMAELGISATEVIRHEVTNSTKIM